LVKSTGEANDDRITLEESVADLILPILPGLETFHIEPGIQSILDQSLVQLVDGFPIAVCVDEEDFCILF